MPGLERYKANLLFHFALCWVRLSWNIRDWWLEMGEGICLFLFACSSCQHCPHKSSSLLKQQFVPVAVGSSFQKLHTFVLATGEYQLLQSLNLSSMGLCSGHLGPCPLTLTATAASYSFFLNVAGSHIPFAFTVLCSLISQPDRLKQSQHSSRKCLPALSSPPCSKYGLAHPFGPQERMTPCRTDGSWKLAVVL